MVFGKKEAKDEAVEELKNLVAPEPPEMVKDYERSEDLETYERDFEDIYLHIKVAKGTGKFGRLLQQFDQDADVEIVQILSSKSGMSKQRDLLSWGETSNAYY